MTVTQKSHQFQSGSEATSGTRNVPKEVSQRKLSEFFRIIEEGFCDIPPSEAQYNSSTLIHHAMVRDLKVDDAFITKTSLRVIDQNIFLTRLYEAWQEVKATNQSIRKEVANG